MPTVSNDPRPSRTTEASWVHCARCGVLFPADPGQLQCRHCRPGGPPDRCEATHPDDRSPCEWPRDAVRIADQDGNQAYGCVHHASVALASIDGARAYTGSVAGAAVETYRRAQLRRPFDFDLAGPTPSRDRLDGLDAP